ncbi:MAG: ABC transporter permease [Calditrichaeota bacterium]|nr:ABC transporter permease [Calditrichota bacterium]
MLLLIAWRNIWRNFKRSGIIIVSIAFGIWAGVFTIALSLGMVNQMVEDALRTYISHIQIHKPGFRQRREVKLVIPAGREIAAQLGQAPSVQGAAPRSVVAGMAGSPTSTNGVQIIGIDPQAEAKVTDISERLIDGEYFESSKRNQAVIGKKLAERLNLRVGSKIVLTAPMPSGEIGAGAFKVVGIYKTSTSMYDETTVFVNIQEADRIFVLSGGIHEIAVVMHNIDQADSLTTALRSQFPDLEIFGWKDISPELAMMTEMMDQSLLIIMIIILLALVFGITNTMLMGVLERTRELGILMALGLKNGKVFVMILWETILLSLVGGAVGILAGIVTNALCRRTGIDFSLFAEGLEAFGMAAIVYPAMHTRHYIIVSVLVILTAVIAAIYPGIKAMRLKPVEAIRTY